MQRYINVYQPKYKNGAKATGLGDFLRGSIWVLQMAMRDGVGFGIHIQNHPISKWVFSDSHIRSSSIHGAERAILSDSDVTLLGHLDNLETEVAQQRRHKTPVFVACNHFPLYPITDFQRSIVQSKLQPTPELEEHLTQVMKSYSLVPKGYNVFHVRSGDKYLVGKAAHNRAYLDQIEQALRMKIHPEERNLLVSDSKTLKAYLSRRFPRLVIIPSRISHLGEDTPSDEQVLDTLMDFFLISRAKHVTGMSCYEHGTGFSEQCASIFSVPYQFLQLRDLTATAPEFGLPGFLSAKFKGKIYETSPLYKKALWG